MRIASLIMIAVKSLLLLTGIAHGEVTDLEVRGQTCAAQGCRQFVGRATAFTIGTMRDGRTAVITAAHNLEGVRPEPGNVTLGWYDGRRVNADVIAVSPVNTLDVALLAADLPGVQTYCNLLDVSPAETADATIQGCAGGTKSVSKMSGRWRAGTTVIDGCRPIKGMSGGPATVHGTNDCFGVVTGYGEGQPHCLIAGSRGIRRWLEKSIGYVPEPATNPLEPTPLEVVPGPPVQPANVIGCGCGRPFCLCRPPRPGASTTPVVPPTTTVVPTPPATAGNSAVLAEIAALKAAIAAIPAGPRGERGPQGERGERGPAGPPASIDASEIAALRAEIERLRNVTFPVRTLTPDGAVFSEDRVRLGDPIEFRLVPRKPQ